MQHAIRPDDAHRGDRGPKRSEGPTPMEDSAERRIPARASTLRELLKLPFHGSFWRHLLFALLLPLGLTLILLLQYAMKASQDHGHQELGPLILLAALAVAAVAGPTFERLRLRLYFGEVIPARTTGRIKGGLAFFAVNLVASTLAFALAASWIIVSARNLTYPVWGWEPYPSDAWGGPTPAGAVALHFAAGVVAFLALPWCVLRVTEWQRAAARRFLSDNR